MGWEFKREASNNEFEGKIDKCRKIPSKADFEKPTCFYMDLHEILLKKQMWIGQNCHPI